MWIGGGVVEGDKLDTDLTDLQGEIERQERMEEESGCFLKFPLGAQVM